MSFFKRQRVVASEFHRRVQDTRGGTFLVPEVGKDIGRYTLKGQFSWYTDTIGGLEEEAGDMW